jgi:hypothetical protein
MHVTAPGVLSVTRGEALLDITSGGFSITVREAISLTIG